MNHAGYGSSLSNSQVASGSPSVMTTWVAPSSLQSTALRSNSARSTDADGCACKPVDRKIFTSAETISNEIIFLMELAAASIRHRIHRRQCHRAEQAGVADGPDGGVEAAALREAGEVGVVEIFP